MFRNVQFYKKIYLSKRFTTAISQLKPINCEDIESQVSDKNKYNYSVIFKLIKDEKKKLSHHINKFNRTQKIFKDAINEQADYHEKLRVKAIDK